MNYAVEIYSKETGVCLGVIDLDPRDYLGYDSVEEAEHEIVSNMECPEFTMDDYDEYHAQVDSDHYEIDIPDEFWRDWEELKNSNSSRV